MSSKEWFDILGIAPTKDLTIIKRAYRKKALLYHPDRNPSKDAAVRFIRVNEAYENILILLNQKENPQASRPHPQPRRSSGPTVEDIQRENAERMRRAREYYENMRRKEEEDLKQAYSAMKSGKRWEVYKFFALVSALLAFVLILDYVILPTKHKKVQMTHFNTQINYSSLGNNQQIENALFSEGTQINRIFKASVNPAILNNKKVWIPQLVGVTRKNAEFHLKETLIFKDIKTISFWEKNKVLTFIPDYSIAVTFPLTPIILLLPMLSFILKQRHVIFLYFFYHTFLYTMPILFLYILISNNRWLSLLGFS